MDVNQLVAWTGVLLSGIVTVILVPLGIYFARFAWDRWRWEQFEKLIRAWLQQEFFPDDMTEDDWHALAAIKLSEAGFEPAKMKDFIEMAVWFAKGRTRQELRGRIAEGRKE